LKKVLKTPFNAILVY